MLLVLLAKRYSGELRCPATALMFLKDTCKVDRTHNFETIKRVNIFKLILLYFFNKTLMKFFAQFCLNAGCGKTHGIYCFLIISLILMFKIYIHTCIYRNI